MIPLKHVKSIIKDKVADKLSRIFVLACALLKPVIGLLATYVDKVVAQFFIYLMVVITFAVGGIAPIAISIWSAVLVAGGDNQLAIGDPFIVAQVVAIFGGFGLFAGFSSTVTGDLRRSLRWMANLYLLSAVSFAMLGLFLPALSTSQSIGDPHTLLLVIIMTCILFGAITFSIGTFIWALQIPELLDGSEVGAD